MNADSTIEEAKRFRDSARVLLAPMSADQEHVHSFVLCCIGVYLRLSAAK